MCRCSSPGSATRDIYFNLIDKTCLYGVMFGQLLCRTAPTANPHDAPAPDEAAHHQRRGSTRMSVDKAFREMVRNEIEAQLKPLRDLVSRLEAGTSDLDSLRNVAEQLAPLASAVGPLFGVASAGRAAPPVARPTPRRPPNPPAPARPPKGPAPPAPVPSAGAGGRRRARKPADEGGARDCAIQGCGKPS